MLLSSQAYAGVTSCGPADAPAPYNSVLNCAAFGPPVCTALGDTVTCNANACTGGTEDFVAINYTGGNDVSVFGRCELSGGPATTFCCHIGDFSTSYDTITLIGSKNEDVDMGFRYSTFQLAESTPNSLLAEANGGNGDDTLLGSNRNAAGFTEVLRGDKGDDTLRGGSGNDAIYGGSGDDFLFGDDGADKLYGEDGIDEMHGGSQNDRMYGGADGDTMNGDNGHDTMFGGDESDTMSGGNGHDTLFGGDQSDTMNGGSGRDNLVGQDGNDTLSGDAGNDKLHGGRGNDLLRGGNNNDILYGSIGSDELIGEGGDDFLCDTNRPSLIGCGTNEFRSTASGTVNGQDKAWQERDPAGFCPNADPVGNFSILEVRDGSWNWSSVVAQTGTTVNTTTPYPQCDGVIQQWGF